MPAGAVTAGSANIPAPMVEPVIRATAPNRPEEAAGASTMAAARAGAGAGGAAGVAPALPLAPLLEPPGRSYGFATADGSRMLVLEALCEPRVTLANWEKWRELP